MSACIFCKIIKGEIPCFKLTENNNALAFLDINPLSKGHALVIPKTHAAKLVDLPDEDLKAILPMVRDIAKAAGAVDFNVLQNNGKIAHQEVEHVHFHMIPKPSVELGLGLRWNQQDADMDSLKVLHEELKSKMPPKI
ncbi:HIT domain protein [Hypoxylon sp. FL1150]|nr:HIT domain protein [Hypoxylon sp. FL1150]